MDPSRPKSGYIPVLDGWRAVAIFLVVVHHTFNLLLLEHVPLDMSIWTFFARLGALGVLIFFSISGYLITSRLLVERARTHGISLQSFYIRRVFRILPPAVFYLFLLVPMYFAGWVVLTWSDLGALFFISNYLPRRSAYTSHFWSLSVEEHFYVFWPAIVAFATLRRALWIGLAVAALVAVWRPWNLQGKGPFESAYLQHTDMRIDYLMFGCVAAIAITLWPGLIHRAAWLGSSLVLIVMAAAMAALGGLNFPFDTRSIQAAILALMISGSALNPHSLICRLLSLPPFLFIGRISYSIYIWQTLILHPTGRPALYSPLALGGRWAIIVGIAYLSYRFIEQPAIAFGKRLVLSKDRRMAAAPT